jgi:hypothetical protein
MKKIFLLIIIIISTSCNRVIYSTELDVKKQGVNFREGKWLLAKIDSPKEFYLDLNTSVNDAFKTYLNDRFYSSLPNSSTLLLSNKLALNPTKTILETLKKETFFDYIINVKAEKIANNAGGIIALTSNELILPKNSVRLTLEIYDLKNTEIIYSKTYNGYTETQRTQKIDVNFVKTNKQILKGCFKKIIKDLDRKSVK